MTGIGVISVLERILTRCTSSSSEGFHLPGPSSLPSLPLEILLHVVRYLPLSSAAILTLCSKLLWSKLGTTYFEQLKEGKRQLDPGVKVPVFTEQQEHMNTFLLLLERDFDEMIFCYFCQKLHTTISHRLNQRAKIPCLDTYTAWGYYDNGATFARLSFAMKCHRKGLDIRHILDPLSVTLTGYEHDWTYQQLFVARVVSGSLYLRTQHWVLLPPKRQVEFPTSLNFWMLCCHVRVLSGSRYEYPHTRSLQSRLHEYQQFDTDAMHSTCVEQCIACRTEFQIDIKDITRRGTAVVITVWQDFGELITPFDLTWRSHLFPFPLDYLRRVPSFTRGSLKKGFEGEHFDFDAHRTKAAAAKFRIKKG
jgi:hypothetical protein